MPKYDLESSLPLDLHERSGSEIKQIFGTNNFEEMSRTFNFDGEAPQTGYEIVVNGRVVTDPA